MDNVEFFQSKNPAAPSDCCDYAAMLYEILLRQDAFEHGVQIENDYECFNFLFPHGEIAIASKTIHSGMTPIPCYICYRNGSANDFVCFGLGRVSTWLQDNWDNLIEGDKND